MSRTPSDGEIRLITKVARMYHERGIRQTNIADTLHLSQARVSRLLRRATELGIVRTVVIGGEGMHTQLEEALEEKYALADAVVVDVQGSEHDIAAALGSAGASYLETTLTGGERIGISSWSQTLLAAVDRMHSLRLPGADSVIQLVGGFGAPSAQAAGNRLLTELARLIGASPIFVPAPGLVGKKAIRDTLLTDPAMEDVATEWARLTMVLVGIGSLPPSPLLRASGNAVDPAEQDKLLAAGAVGDVCQRYFDAAGDPVRSALDDRVVGIDADMLRRVRHRVGIAGGQSKHAAIHAALTGGWVNVILTDTGTAEALLARH
ncbi:sugar-binding domain-containing protein [Actinoplanes sp. NPDC051633]|uniref:sugar-binding transcriptional regulator n=1 Tax=Actinoplanes sp. NPDC051633 TaxID=3155670 RepID=UPI00342811B0